MKLLSVVLIIVSLCLMNEALPAPAPAPANNLDLQSYLAKLLEQFKNGRSEYAVKQPSTTQDPFPVYDEIITEQASYTHKPITTTPKPEPLSDNKDRCLIQKCGNSPLFKSHVCGSDKQTYLNKKILDCYRKECKKNINFLKWGPCNPTTTTTTTTTTRPPTNDDENGDETPQVDQACWKVCPRLEFNYNPVCGSDNETYQNDSFLQCTNKCGKPVRLAKKTRC